MINVFHNKNFTDWKSGEEINQFDLLMVAQVRSSHLEKAFQMTNSVEQGWWIENHGEDLRIDQKLLVQKRGFRSTSVGDVLVIVERQLWYVVSAVGFKQLLPVLKEVENDSPED